MPQADSDGAKEEKGLPQADSASLNDSGRMLEITAARYCRRLIRHRSIIQDGFWK
ncbi:hypothetical protein [Cohnella nanjingensis]|uniref:Uncharacterized protein n=1 Tax=Cohnella nanjingensis TaxID=1387779 RepID=A0A7X0VJ81_9BACL|nr:hypothetical protein [Cohnella nanjingensis]MBB6674439.1 hypothetical protein [Cohnella nanjingensis]